MWYKYGHGFHWLSMKSRAMSITLRFTLHVCGALREEIGRQTERKRLRLYVRTTGICFPPGGG